MLLKASSTGARLARTPAATRVLCGCLPTSAVPRVSGRRPLAVPEAPAATKQAPAGSELHGRGISSGLAGKHGSSMGDTAAKAAAPAVAEAGTPSSARESNPLLQVWAVGVGLGSMRPRPPPLPVL
jgi:hypothetical protein